MYRNLINEVNSMLDSRKVSDIFNLEGRCHVEFEDGSLCVLSEDVHFLDAKDIVEHINRCVSVKSFDDFDIHAL